MGYAPANLTDLLGGATVSRRSRMRGQAMRRSLLPLCDIVAATFALVLATSAVSPLFGLGWLTSVELQLAALAVAFAVVVPSSCLGLYGTVSPGPIERFRLHAWSALLLPWIAATVVGVFATVTLPILVVLVSTAVLFIPISLVLETYLRRALIAHSLWGTTALLIGSGATVVQASRFLLAHPELGLQPIGFLGEAEEGHIGPLPARLGSLADINRFADVAEVAVVALSLSTQSLELSGLPFRHVLFLPDLGASQALWGRSRAIGDIPALEFVNRAQTAYARSMKRALDLAIGVPFLLASLPLLGLLALAIKAVSPGPAFYTQRRVGLDGKPIEIFKLRSMFPNAEQRLQELLERDPEACAEWERFVKLRNDPRILPFIGHLIRRTSLDELPQLCNVVRGDISLVGPRPFPSYHINRFNPAFQALRQSIQPGLTGLWQVSDRSDADLPQQEALDSFYIRNWSIWLDLWILLHTLPAMLSLRGAR